MSIGYCKAVAVSWTLWVGHCGLVTVGRSLWVAVGSVATPEKKFSWAAGGSEKIPYTQIFSPTKTLLPKNEETYQELHAAGEP